MKDNKKDLKKPQQDMNEQYKNEKKQKKLVTKIVLSIFAVLIILFIILGISAYNFYTSSIEPLNPSSEEEIQVEVPTGSSPTDIAHILEENGIINSASVFNIYTRLNDEANFKAGYYVFSPSMDMEDIVSSLQQGGTDLPLDAITNIPVPEGSTLTQIATFIETNTSFTAEDVMMSIKNEAFHNSMLEKYPELLTSASEAEEVRYLLEGYFYPATYPYHSDMTIEELLESMIGKMDAVMSKYYKQINENGYTVHEILTMASLVEREGIEYDDRTKIADVFYNRIELGMPLQTDVAILYALDKHKELVTYEDLEVDSPYNLYQNTGIGPGPFNSPSEESITATLSPADTNYLYFLADIDTKKVYFSETYEQHLAYQKEYVDSKEH